MMSSAFGLGSDGMASTPSQDFVGHDIGTRADTGTFEQKENVHGAQKRKQHINTKSKHGRWNTGSHESQANCLRQSVAVQAKCDLTGEHTHCHTLTELILREMSTKKSNDSGGPSTCTLISNGSLKAPPSSGEAISTIRYKCGRSGQQTCLPSWLELHGGVSQDRCSIGNLEPAKANKNAPLSALRAKGKEALSAFGEKKTQMSLADLRARGKDVLRDITQNARVQKAASLEEATKCLSPRVSHDVHMMPDAVLATSPKQCSIGLMDDGFIQKASSAMVDQLVDEKIEKVPSYEPVKIDWKCLRTV